MGYDRLSIPTTYRTVRYRSQHEARWAVIFDRLGWNYLYVDKPHVDFELRNLPGLSDSVLVEVKPKRAFLDDALDRIEEFERAFGGPNFKLRNFLFLMNPDEAAEEWWETLETLRGDDDHGWAETLIEELKTAVFLYWEETRDETSGEDW